MSESKLKGVPILRISNVDEAKRFYCESLGFTLDWEHYYEDGAPVYMQVSRDGLTLHLSQNKRFHEATIVYVQTEGMDELHSEFSSKASGWGPPSISLTAWNTRQMEIHDPFGNLLRFNEETG